MTEEHDTSGALSELERAYHDAGASLSDTELLDASAEYIRALESDLKSARERERELEQDARISHAHLDGLMDLLGVDDTDKAHTEIGRLQVDLRAAREENWQYKGMIYGAASNDMSELEALKADNARLAGEVEQLREAHRRDTDYITELHTEKEEFQADRNAARGEIEDEWRPLADSLRARLVAAEERVKALEPVAVDDAVAGISYLVETVWGFEVAKRCEISSTKEAYWTTAGGDLIAPPLKAYQLPDPDTQEEG